MPQLSDTNNDTPIAPTSEGLDFDFFANLPVATDNGSNTEAPSNNEQQLAGISTDDAIKIGSSIAAGVAGAWLIKRFWDNWF